MSINLDVSTIATNLASIWSSVTAPTGLDSITLSTHLLPNAIHGTPVLLVKPPVGEFEYGPGHIGGELNFPCEFYLTEAADYRTQLKALYAWFGTLFAQPEAQYDLNAPITGHIDVTITDSRMGILNYAEHDYAGIQFIARVRLAAGYNATT